MIVLSLWSLLRFTQWQVFLTRSRAYSRDALSWVGGPIVCPWSCREIAYSAAAVPWVYSNRHVTHVCGNATASAQEYEHVPARAMQETEVRGF